MVNHIIKDKPVCFCLQGIIHYRYGKINNNRNHSPLIWLKLINDKNFVRNLFDKIELLLIY